MKAWKRFVGAFVAAVSAAVCFTAAGTVTLANAQTEEEHTCQYTVYEYDDEAHWFACDCGQTDGAPQEHSYTVKQDETGHWEECVCGKMQGREAHDHSKKQDETGHWDECSVCHRTTPKNNHAGGSLTCTDRKTCVICGQAYGEEPLGHRFEIEADATHHWKVCELCDAEEGKSVHKGGTATEDEQAICEECGEPYGDFAEESSASEEETEQKAGCNGTLGGGAVWLGAVCLLAVLRKKKSF